MSIFPLAVCGVRIANSVNLGAPHISETVRARKVKLYIHVDRIGSSALFGNENFSARGHAGAQRPQRKFGTPSYLVTLRARKL